MQCLFPTCFPRLFLLGFVFHVRVCNQDFGLQAGFNWGAKNKPKNRKGMLPCRMAEVFLLESLLTGSFPTEPLCWAAMSAK